MPKGAKIRIRREKDGKEFTLPLSRLNTATKQWVKENRHRLEEPEFVGEFWWNCPARHERNWFICKKVYRQGSLTIVHEYSTGHSNGSDGIEVTRLSKTGRNAEREDGSRFGMFLLTSRGLETDAGMHYPTAAEAKAGADAEIAEGKARRERKVKQRDAEALDKYVSILNQAGVGNVISNVSRREGTATVTVSNAWFLISKGEKKQIAQNLQSLWWKCRGGKPDEARIKIEDVNGNDLAGSRWLGGTLIYVND